MSYTSQNCQAGDVKLLDLPRVVERFVALTTVTMDTQALFHTVVSQMHSLCASARDAELQGVGRSMILNYLGPARTLHAQSPFVARLQSWPRGYAGDFETIEYLCEAKNRALEGTAAYCIERYALTSGVAQQHRNKVAWQARRIVEICRERGSDCRVLSVACGGSRDIRTIEAELVAIKPTLILNDLDAGALDFSLKTLPSLSSGIKPIAGDAFHTARALKRAGPYDLILAGGLFDYLDDRHACWLLGQLHGMLKRAGRLCFTNIAAGNPYRVWMEYLANWTLIERSVSDIHRLVRDSGLEGKMQTSLSMDGTELTYLVELSCESNDASSRVCHQSTEQKLHAGEGQGETEPGSNKVMIHEVAGTRSPMHNFPAEPPEGTIKQSLQVTPEEHKAALSV